jgi:hypothetical protein
VPVEFAAAVRRLSPLVYANGLGVASPIIEHEEFQNTVSKPSGGTEAGP